MARLEKLYKEVVASKLLKELKYSNVHQVPRLHKIVINMGVSDAKDNPKAMENAGIEFAAITGQKAQIRTARKSISSFKLRKGMPNGMMVTLRGKRMYEFFDRLVNIAIPRIRDFRGVNPSGFDGRGNYNLGIREQYIFPEVNIAKSDKPRGMNITIVTSAQTDSDAKTLLEGLGMPFRKTGAE